MRYIELSGGSVKDDIATIKKAIDENSATVFVYSGLGTLYDYIDALYDKGRGLDSDYLYKFKICYEKRDLQVSYSANGGKRAIKINTMSGLINELDGKTDCRIVVETDDRVQLAFIVQQLIYIDYPLETVDILLRKEEADADKTKRFMKNINELKEGNLKAIASLTSLRYRVESEEVILGSAAMKTKADRLKDIDNALDSCYKIKDQIDKSLSVELKLAVAASKKTGKSVIVNCFLGKEVAPTSTELATPNNCIYRKSPDNRYHLQLEGGAVQTFDSREQIYDKINEYFRNAQNDYEHGFALPDMNISYVTEDNNFSSYTIYDTAGPDAAGTSHDAVAEKAMRVSDVVIFAIDYAKYLTKPEADYLGEVKSIFDAQHKFHSLIFALNKMDVRYTDANSTKSFVMSVDFIKTRLAEVDKNYKDCIIFPTCSLEYFDAIEAESAGVNELTEEISLEDMQKVKRAHRDVRVLQWLSNHAENLGYYHGIEKISYDVFKKDSGMPALMSYVSYVAKSKARDEIVNNVTFEIASQKQKLQSVLDYISNLEVLINAEDEQIKKISRIIGNYKESVDSILNKDYTKEELEILGTDSILRRIGGKSDKIKEQSRKAIEAGCDADKVAEAMYDKVVDLIWKRIDGQEKFDGKQIDNLFTADDMNQIAKDITKARMDEAARDIYGTLQKVNEDVKKIIKDRQRRLCEVSAECKEALEKEHVDIELPSIPEFEFAAVMTLPNNLNFSVTSTDFKLYDKLSGLFKKKGFKNIGIWITGFLSGTKKDKEFIREFNADKNKFVEICDNNLKSDIKYAVTTTNRVPTKMTAILIENLIDDYMTKLFDEIQVAFNSMNKNYTDCVEQFSLAVDDRDKYKQDMDSHNLRKSNIMEIADSTNEFMDAWKDVVSDIALGEGTLETADVAPDGNKEEVNANT